MLACITKSLVFFMFCSRASRVVICSSVSFGLYDGIVFSSVIILLVCSIFWLYDCCDVEMSFLLGVCVSVVVVFGLFLGVILIPCIFLLMFFASSIVFWVAFVTLTAFVIFVIRRCWMI